jgi:cytochrome P450
MVDIVHGRTAREAGPANPVRAALFDPPDREFLANPYPTYDRLCVADPVPRTPLGLWVLTRYDDVALVLRDPRFSRPMGACSGCAGAA